MRLGKSHRGMPAEVRRVHSSPARPVRNSSASLWSRKRMPQLHSAPTLRRCFGGSTTLSSLHHTKGRFGQSFPANGVFDAIWNAKQLQDQHDGQ